ncbi:MAG: AAA family ATPase [Ruminococcus sp.]|nr:AAA family ATPase [Ruminococcus sp.]
MTETEKQLEYINPAELDYDGWLAVGMALKREGLPCSVWADWSKRDSARYHEGECERKWETIGDVPNPITGGTLAKMAREHGYRSEGRALDWDDVISFENGIIDQAWIEDEEVIEPSEWRPEKELIAYLETLFEPSENVGYVVKSFKEEESGKMKPASGGSYDRTAGQLIEELNICEGDIGAVLGDYDPECGAWIRFNPLDGSGVKNANVTEFRYALVESDNVPIERQNALIRELELPVAMLVYSGGKSLHAIVRVEAANYDEYRQRVDFLYDICKKNGLEPDTANRNPSRLSRMPGVVRGGRKQFIVAKNIGKSSWNEWRDFIQGVNDDLPEIENIADVWDNLPELSPPLIEGVLRQGHKMLVAGPSKAGKSFALIELCAAIAEGKTWLGWQCAKGRVLYVNLELDKASCMHRIRAVYEGLGWKPDNARNLDVWNLRGKTIPMDKLAAPLIRRALKRGYIAVVIDPIYKVITGDENSASQMAEFCNSFDKVCTELGCAVIYCHHHSKGAQGSKRSMDRASGSGVFARDPDALLDLIELEVTDNLVKEERGKAVCQIVAEELLKRGYTEFSDDDRVTSRAMLEHARRALSGTDLTALEERVKLAEKKCEIRSAWRVEGTLREFPRFAPVNVWFDYPVHRIDLSGVLKDVNAEGDLPVWQSMNEKRRKQAEKQNDDNKEKFESAVNSANCGEPPTLGELINYLGSNETTVRRWIKKFDYEVEKRTKTVVKKTTTTEN